MTKPKSKPKTATRSATRKAAKTAPRKRPAPVSSKSAAEPDTKHDRIIAMLRSPAGATIAAIMTATDWQQHSVRGFLAGVVRRKLGLDLVSEQTDKGRVYRIRDGKAAHAAESQAKQAPDAMQKQRRNRTSTKTSVEDEIAHLRGLDLKGLRSRWQGVFQRAAPAHLTRHLLFAVIAYGIQADRFGDIDHSTRQMRTATPSCSRLLGFVHKDRLIVHLKSEGTNEASVSPDDESLTIPWQKPPSKKSRQILLPHNTSRSNVRPERFERRVRLVEAIARGRWWLDDVVSGRVTTVSELCARENCSVRQVNMTISLAFLAPNLVKAAVEGRLPRGIGIDRLRDLPTEWSQQFKALGLNPE